MLPGPASPFGTCLYLVSLAIETLVVTDLIATQLQAKEISAQSGKEMGHMAIKLLLV